MRHGPAPRVAISQEDFRAAVAIRAGADDDAIAESAAVAAVEGDADLERRMRRHDDHAGRSAADLEVPAVRDGNVKDGHFAVALVHDRNLDRRAGAVEDDLRRRDADGE